MKPDELALLKTLAFHRPKQTWTGPNAEDVGISLGMHHKRVDYILNKWTNKGWWNYGVSARTGWLTEAGVSKAVELFAPGGSNV